MNLAKRGECLHVVDLINRRLCQLARQDFGQGQPHVVGSYVTGAAIAEAR